MSQHSHITASNFRYAAKFGIKNGIALTYGYTIVFISYAIFRSSLTILHQLPVNEGLLATLAGNAFSLVVSSLAIATLIIPGPAILGMISAIIIEWFLSRPRKRPQTSFKIRVIGFVTCLAIAIILQILLLMITGYSWVRSSPGAFCFWFLFPTILYVWNGGYWASRLFDHRLETNAEPGYLLVL